MPYSAPVRTIQEWLRARVRRDSAAWRVLFGVKQAAGRLEERWRARAWAAAEREFEGRLRALADARPDFFFVQVGAHDGGMDDPLRPWIEARGWRGLFVEPQPEQFARLRERHGASGRFLFENVAIDRTRGTRELFRVDGAEHHAPEISGLASLLPDRALATHAALGRMRSIPVVCVPLQDLVDRHGLARIDLLQVDTEGHDAAVLETLDLGRMRPALIHYEHRHLSGTEQAACARRLRRHGYRVRLKRHDAFAWLGD
jgi:FkbM family methyltransferase